MTKLASSLQLGAVKHALMDRARLAYRKYAPSAPVPVDDLTRLANKYRSDKGNLHFNRHFYSRIYFDMFKVNRHQSIRLLEIGLLHHEDAGWGNEGRDYVGTAAGHRAPSLQMWSAFFPNGAIFGFDINDFADVQIDRCTIFRGDMGSRHDLRGLVQAAGGGFDIIIDDASHASQHQQIALASLFPSLRPGGLYFVEDLNWQPPQIEDQQAPKTRELLRRCQILGEVHSPFIEPAERAYLQWHIEAIALFDSASPFRSPLDNVDALAVICKKGGV